MASAEDRPCLRITIKTDNHGAYDMTIRDAMPTAALHHAAACLKEVGYVPRQPRRIFGPSEPQSAGAARLGAEVQAFINWVIDMREASRGVSTAAPVSATDARIALHLALDGADLLDATDTAEVSAAARRAWAADPGYVSELMKAAWDATAAPAGAG